MAAVPIGEPGCRLRKRITANRAVPNTTITKTPPTAQCDRLQRHRRVRCAWGQRLTPRFDPSSAPQRQTKPTCSPPSKPRCSHNRVPYQGEHDPRSLHAKSATINIQQRFLLFDLCRFFFSDADQSANHLDVETRTFSFGINIFDITPERFSLLLKPLYAFNDAPEAVGSNAAGWLRALGFSLACPACGGRLCDVIQSTVSQIRRWRPS